MLEVFCCVFHSTTGCLNPQIQGSEFFPHVLRIRPRQLRFIQRRTSRRGSSFPAASPVHNFRLHFVTACSDIVGGLYTH